MSRPNSYDGAVKFSLTTISCGDMFSARPVWYENLSGVVIRPDNLDINIDGADSIVIGSRDQ